MSYEILSKITSEKYSDKSVLIVGTGFMSRQYCSALKKMGVNDVIVFSREKNNAINLCNEFGFKPLFGDLENQLRETSLKDLVIITSSVSTLTTITKKTIQAGYQNILVEKPGSLYYQDLISLDENIKAKIKIAYNRLAYPNFYRLKEIIKDEKITSCRYTITEKIDSINFTKDTKETFERWGISNSLHVISMVHELIGMPKEIHSKQYGRLQWHPSGSIFIGDGITEEDIPFSYHADWESAGRWGIEIMTENNAYRLMPLEKLYVCKKGSFEWNEIPIDITYPDVKQGIAEEISLMFHNEFDGYLPSPKKAASFIKLAELIFGYVKN